MKILFATRNNNKTKEIKALLPDFIELINLNDLDIHEEIPEDQDTIQGNACQKTDYIVSNYKVDCFADDTGLEVFSLNNEPGVFSARYAGEQRDDNDNMNLLLKKLEGKANREAQFRTVISLSIKGDQFTFEGIVKGKISLTKKGLNGFGYDPIFIPEGGKKTFAEMTMEEKNMNSHRGRAIQKLISFIQNLA